MQKIKLNGQPMNLDLTLACGQAFRWQKNSDGIWFGVVGDKLIELTMENDYLYWQTYPSNDENLVKDYMRLSDDVSLIYSKISERDKNLMPLIEKYYGLRLVRQDPTEALLSFLCSAANSIPKIMLAISMLCSQYGEIVCEKDKQCYYAFPTPESLAKANVDDLRAIKPLAFRGRHIYHVSNYLISKPENWMNSLRNMPYPEARSHLVDIKGVGRKIADCVCLFSLDKDEIVPVDTHIRQIAKRLNFIDSECKSLTPGMYENISNAFIERYGKFAGWAQQFLFLDDL